MSDVFKALGRHPPQRQAITFPERSLSYAALREASARVARSVTGLSRVAVLAEARIETCVG